jgi:hypothetical protein
VTHAGEHHGQSSLVRGFDDFGIAKRAPPDWITAVATAFAA